MPHEGYLEITPLHPTFAAQVKGVDFSEPVPDQVVDEIKAAMAKYGVLVFRNTTLTDDTHIKFAAQFGELDDVTPYTKIGEPNRLSSPYLFDVSNLEPDGSVTPLTSARHVMNRANTLFHVDSSFNPRRAGYCLLRAVSPLPPSGAGAATQFADSRTAFDDLPADVKAELQGKGYVGAHSLLHSKQMGSPGYYLPDVDPATRFMARHRVAQVHEASGRWNLYVASHLHHIYEEDGEGGGGRRSAKLDALRDELYQHVTRDEYVVRVEWEAAGDLLMWDNTCVLHRATPGRDNYKGVRYPRDVRRATVHDGSSQAWGLNDRGDAQQAYPSTGEMDKVCDLFTRTLQH